MTPPGRSPAPPDAVISRQEVHRHQSRNGGVSKVVGLARARRTEMSFIAAVGAPERPTSRAAYSAAHPQQRPSPPNSSSVTDTIWYRQRLTYREAEGVRMPTVHGAAHSGVLPHPHVVGL
jgi:hypothetical protein